VYYAIPVRLPGLYVFMYNSLFRRVLASSHLTWLNPSPIQCNPSVDSNAQIQSTQVPIPSHLHCLRTHNCLTNTKSSFTLGRPPVTRRPPRVLPPSSESPAFVVPGAARAASCLPIHPSATRPHAQVPPCHERSSSSYVSYVRFPGDCS